MRLGDGRWALRSGEQREMSSVVTDMVALEQSSLEFLHRRFNTLVASFSFFSIWEAAFALHQRYLCFIRGGRM